MSQIELKVDRQRLEDLVTVGDIIAAEEGNLKAIRNLMAVFLVDETGQYYPTTTDAQQVINGLTIGQLNSAGGQLTAALQENAVPKAN